MNIMGYRFEIIPKSKYEENRHKWENADRRDFAVEDGVTYLLTQLQHDTPYLVRVASKNLAGLSDWSEIKEFRTLAFQPHRTAIESRSDVLSLSNISIVITSLLIIIRNFLG